MTKKDDFVLEEALKKVQQEKLDEENHSIEKGKNKFQEKINLLEKQKQETLDIAKKVQYDYINLKADFDRLKRVFSEKEKSMEINALINHIKNFFPVIDQLKTSLDHVDESNKDDSFVEGVKMVYNNMLKVLASFGIFPIESLGLVPDGLFHEPLSTIPVEEKSQKGKILQVYEQGYYLEKDGQKSVIVPSKVIVGV